MIFQGTMTTGDLLSYLLFALQSVFAFQVRACECLRT